MATMVVEDGTGLSTANSYCSIVDADDHHSMRLHNTTWTSIASDTQKEMALMWASRLLDEEVDWYGVKTAEDSGLRWPRTGVYDKDNDLIGESEMPTDVVRATAEFAMFLVAEDRSLESDLMGFKHLEAEKDSEDVHETEEYIQVLTKLGFTYTQSKQAVREAIKEDGAGGKEDVVKAALRRLGK